MASDDVGMDPPERPHCLHHPLPLGAPLLLALGTQESPPLEQVPTGECA